MISVLFIVVLASFSGIKNSILLYPGLLELVKYTVVILAGLCLSIALEASKGKRNYFNLLAIMVFLMLGLAFGYMTNGYWLTFFVLLDAVTLFFVYQFQLNRNSIIGFSALFAGIILMGVFVPPSELFPSQKNFRDRVIFSTETPFQKIDITSWKGHYWVYSNSVIQFSTLDEPMYYEPMVHPMMNLVSDATNILIVGGENGIIVREVKKYREVQNIDLVPLDTGLLSLAKNHPIFMEANEKALSSDKISMCTVDAFRHLENQENQFDVIIIETVGVGQSEIEIAKMADTSIVMAAPGAGDGIQAAKAGILEIADIFAVNKADRPGVDSTMRELRAMLAMAANEPGWIPPVIPTIAIDGSGFTELAQAISEHYAYLIDNGLLELKRIGRIRESLLARVINRLAQQAIAVEASEELAARCALGDLSEDEACDLIRYGIDAP